ncbi:hypothetical protein ACVWXO_005268 [Bradyrhizobium sp. LM2.7]
MNRFAVGPSIATAFEARRSRHHPEAAAAWRHQADQRSGQGDRDQDAAAGPDDTKLLD